MRFYGIALLVLLLSAGSVQANIQPDSLTKQLEPSLENLFYGNVNEVLTKLFWIGDSEVIGLRYNAVRPKDIVLFNSNRLIVDSLSINQLFLDDYQPGSIRFVSIDGIVQSGQNSFVILHGYGATRVQVVEGKFVVIEKRIEPRKPEISDRYFTGYKLLHLGKYTIGYRYDLNKYIKSADYWVYNWESGKLSEYQDSKYREESTNRYWSLKNTPEAYSTISHFIYNIIQTRDGFIFNLPLKNRFLSYSEKAGNI